MNTIKRNLAKYYLFKPRRKRTKEDYVVNEYKKPNCEFYGNLQPVTQSSVSEQYGVSLTHLYKLYVKPDIVSFEELDRIGTTQKAPIFEIKHIQKWHNYWCLAVEELNNQ